jgi:hypothetical protein
MMALDGVNDHSLSRKAMKAELLDAETELRLAYSSPAHYSLYAPGDFHGFKVPTLWRSNERLDSRSKSWFDESSRKV